MVDGGVTMKTIFLNRDNDIISGFEEYAKHEIKTGDIVVKNNTTYTCLGVLYSNGINGKLTKEIYIEEIKEM